MLGANTLTGLLTFGVSAFGMVSRSKEAYGDYALFQRTYEIGQGLFIFGANAAIQRFAAGNDENRRRFGAIAIYLFLGLMVVMTFGGVAVGTFAGWTFGLALFGLPWLILSWWGRYIVRSNLDAKREARLMMIASLSNSLFQFAFLTFTDYRDALIYGDFAALVMSGIAAIWYIRSGLGIGIFEILKTKIPKEFLKESYKFAVPVWWSGQLFSVRNQLQSVWTAAWLGTARVGVLEGSRTFWQFTQKPLEYLGQAALPGLVKEDAERSRLYQEIVRVCLTAFTFIGIAVASGMPLLFDIIDALSGKSGADSLWGKYSEVPMLLRIFALLIPLQAFQMVTNQLAVASGKPRAVLIANIATVIVVLSAIYPLTQRFGLFGVIAAGQLGEAASALTYFVVLRPMFPNELRAGAKWTLLTTLAGAIALAPVQIYADWKWSWVLSFPAVIIFMVMMLVLKVLEIEDLRRVWRSRRGGAA